MFNAHGEWVGPLRGTIGGKGTAEKPEEIVLSGYRQVKEIAPYTRVTIKDEGYLIVEKIGEGAHVIVEDMYIQCKSVGKNAILEAPKMYIMYAAADPTAKMTAKMYTQQVTERNGIAHGTELSTKHTPLRSSKRKDREKSYEAMLQESGLNDDEIENKLDKRRETKERNKYNRENPPTEKEIKEYLDNETKRFIEEHERSFRQEIAEQKHNKREQDIQSAQKAEDILEKNGIEISGRIQKIIKTRLDLDGYSDSYMRSDCRENDYKHYEERSQMYKKGRTGFRPTHPDAYVSARYEMLSDSKSSIMAEIEGKVIDVLGVKLQSSLSQKVKDKVYGEPTYLSNFIKPKFYFNKEQRELLSAVQTIANLIGRDGLSNDFKALLTEQLQESYR